MQQVAKIIAISGPTAVGKTSFAIQLAKRLKTEIISFDSRQIYKELNIGVARPSEEELADVKHHLIAHRSIKDMYTAQDFVSEADSKLEELLQNYGAVVLVGGTGFYLRALEYGLDEFPNISKDTREKIQVELDEKGLSTLQDRLKNIDSESFHTIDIQNPRRIQRILELWDEHKIVYSHFIKGKREKRYLINHIVLDMQRELLYSRINRRVNTMLDNGLKAEAEKLFPYRNLNGLNTVGYSELFEYMEGLQSYEEAIDKIKQHSRNYAKRQITWNRKYLPEAEWIELGSSDFRIKD